MTQKKKNVKIQKLEKREKALFLQRVLAFLVDVFLISVIASIIIFPVNNNDSLEQLTDQSTKIAEQYQKQEIDTTTYMNQSMDISYEIAKQSGLSTIITIIIYILYFVVFQFYQQGQTLGKKLMKIQVVSKDQTELTLNQLLLRSFLVNFILVDIIILLFTIFGGKDLYIGATYLFESIQYIMIFVSIIMIIYRKDGCGVHDLLAHTQVVKCEVKEKELEACES